MQFRLDCNGTIKQSAPSFYCNATFSSAAGQLRFRAKLRVRGNAEEQNFDAGTSFVISVPSGCDENAATGGGSPGRSCVGRPITETMGVPQGRPSDLSQLMLIAMTTSGNQSIYHDDSVVRDPNLRDQRGYGLASRIAG
jgi:hypothetical protein